MSISYIFILLIHQQARWYQGRALSYHGIAPCLIPSVGRDFKGRLFFKFNVFVLIAQYCSTTNESGAFFIIQSAPGHIWETTTSMEIILSYVTIIFAIVETISLVTVVQWYSLGF